jgi:hypothetical protein
LPLRASWLQRLPRRLRLQRSVDRGYLLGLRRLLRILLAMGPVPGPVDQRLLLNSVRVLENPRVLGASLHCG